MDFSRNVTLSGGLPSEYEPEQLFSPPCSKLGSLDDLFSGNNTERDMNLEWLSIFVEDCLSSSGNCLPHVAILPPQVAQNKTATKIIPKAEPPSKPLQLVKSQKSPSSSSSILQTFVIPGKARSKRKRGPIGNKAQRSISAHHLQMSGSGSDPPLLQQAHWLADSELLILPKNEKNNNKSNRGIIRARNEETKEGANIVIMEKEEGRMGSLEGSNGQLPRRCSHCLAQRTPQWRAGPLGPKTLCNACGVRYKSGRLLPEYRPAKSPTFVSHKHSNSHKKVLEIRTTSSLSSDSY